MMCMHAVANDACDGRLTSLDFAQLGRGACTGNSTCLCDVGFVGVSCEESLSTQGCLFNCSSRGSCNENQVRRCAVHLFAVFSGVDTSPDTRWLRLPACGIPSSLSYVLVFSNLSLCVCVCVCAL
jgi:hypothetical protein